MNGFLESESLNGEMVFVSERSFDENVCELSNITFRGINQGQRQVCCIRVDERADPLKGGESVMVSSAHHRGEWKFGKQFR